MISADVAAGESNVPLYQWRPGVVRYVMTMWRRNKCAPGVCGRALSNCRTFWMTELRRHDPSPGVHAIRACATKVGCQCGYTVCLAVYIKGSGSYVECDFRSLVRFATAGRHAWTCCILARKLVAEDIKGYVRRNATICSRVEAAYLSHLCSMGTGRCHVSGPGGRVDVCGVAI